MYNRDRRRSYIMSKLDVKQQKRIGDLIARMLATDSPHEATSCAKLVTRQLESVNLDVRSILFGGGSSAVSAQSEINSRSEEHTSELQSRGHLVCRLLLEKKKQKKLGRYVLSRGQ